jgi:hypothetical protein
MMASIFALVFNVEYRCSGLTIIRCCPDLAGANISVVAMPSKLTQAARVKAGTVPPVPLTYRVS